MPSRKINGKEYPTVVVDGVERFPMNRIVGDLFDFSNFREGDAHSPGLVIDGKRRERFSLNEIWIRFEAGRYTLDEMHEFYRLIGYSVCGFREVFRGPQTLMDDEKPEEFHEEEEPGEEELE